MKTLSFSAFLPIELGGHELRCEYDYSEGTPSTMYRSNGDPGDEGDPEEFAVTKVLLQTAPGVWFDLMNLLEDLGVGERIDELAREQLDAAILEASDGDRE